MVGHQTHEKNLTLREILPDGILNSHCVLFKCCHLFTARKQSCGKVMFSQVSVCPQKERLGISQASWDRSHTKPTSPDIRLGDLFKLGHLSCPVEFELPIWVSLKATSDHHVRGGFFICLHMLIFRGNVSYLRSPCQTWWSEVDFGKTQMGNLNSITALFTKPLAP